MYSRKIIRGPKNSFLVVLPREFMERLKWKHGDIVSVELRDEMIIIRKGTR